MPKQSKSLIIIILLVFITLLFASIVGYYWLRGQNHKFINQRTQLLLEVNKIEGFDLQRIELIKQNKLSLEQEHKVLELHTKLQQTQSYQNIDLLLPQDLLLSELEQQLQVDLTVAQRRQEFVAGLKSRVQVFNDLVSAHLYLRYFSIPTLEVVNKD